MDHVEIERRETREMLRQETARGESFALRVGGELAAAVTERLHWHALGRRVVTESALALWDSLEHSPPSRNDPGDRSARHGVALTLAHALDQLELAEGVALDFTGLPLSERVFDAVVRLAGRVAPRGLIVIAEAEDAAQLARLLR